MIWQHAFRQMSVHAPTWSRWKYEAFQVAEADASSLIALDNLKDQANHHIRGHMLLGVYIWVPILGTPK